MNTKKKVLGALAVLFGLYALATGLRLWGYSGSQQSCDTPVSSARLQAWGIEMTDSVRLCREEESSSSYGADYYVLMARAPVVCVASMGLVGCPSARAEGMRWAIGMTAKGWGTGNLGRQQGSSLTYELLREDSSMMMSVYEDQYHEITGFLQVTAPLARSARGR